MIQHDLIIGPELLSTIQFGYAKGWVSRKDIVDHAVAETLAGEFDDDLALLASSETIEEEEVLHLVDVRSQDEDLGTVSDRWRLATLLAIQNSGDSEQAQVDRLQDAYANFNYPQTWPPAAFTPIPALLRLTR